MSLIIVESPAKCCKIEQYLDALPTKYKCIACCGHFMEIAGLAAIHNKTYEPTFTVISNRKAAVKEIVEEVKTAKENGAQIILATDDDREGEAIAWHLCVLLDLPVATTKRMRFHDLTAASLQKAVSCCDTINMSLVQAQQTRQVLDMLVGYKVSPVLWHHLKKSNLSAGRCQTPALRLIYDNHLACEEAALTQRQLRYEIIGYFTSLNLPFRLLTLGNTNIDTSETTKEFLKASVTHTHCFLPITLQDVQKPAPLPFNTSTLLQAARFSPSDTMAICQSLYEKGFITYIRTESTTFCNEFQQRLSTFLAKEYNLEAKECAQHNNNTHQSSAHEASAHETSAHEAIRPTNLKMVTIPVSYSPSKKEQELYTLIRHRTLESGMLPAVLKSLCVSITAPLQHVYQYHCSSVVYAGWLLVQQDTKKKITDNSFTFLQNLKNNSEVHYKKITAKTELRGVHSHLTEADLIHLLEKHKIGRPSTFASLVEKIKDRQYVKLTNVEGFRITSAEYVLEKEILQEDIVDRTLGAEKHKLVLTHLGQRIITFLLQHYEPLFAYTYTQHMEDKLNNVVLVKDDRMKLCQGYDETIESLSAALGSRGKETIYIDEQHSYVTGKYGPVIKKVMKESQETSFLATTGDLEMKKLRRGEYALEDVALPAGKKESLLLGHHLQQPVWLKGGKFGRYLEIGKEGTEKQRIALKGDPSNHKQLYKVTLADVQEQLSRQETVFTRLITEDAILRSGPHGDYIYYKNSKMKRPKFLQLDGCPAEPRTCDLLLLQQWFHDKYKV